MLLRCFIRRLLFKSNISAFFQHTTLIKKNTQKECIPTKENWIVPLFHETRAKSKHLFATLGQAQRYIG